MMEQAYGTTEDQIREVKSIARRFLGKTQNYQGFSQSFKTSVEEQVNKKVLGLLQEQKPRGASNKTAATAQKPNFFISFQFYVSKF